MARASGEEMEDARARAAFGGDGEECLLPVVAAFLFLVEVDEEEEDVEAARPRFWSRDASLALAGRSIRAVMVLGLCMCGA